MEAEKDIFLIVSEHKRQSGSNFVFKVDREDHF